MRFPNKFVNLVNGCVTTVSYSLLLNGSRLSSFKPTRGLRQGDSLSLYLFVMCAEVFSFFIKISRCCKVKWGEGC